jgi:hypothetical protein
MKSHTNDFKNTICKIGREIDNVITINGVGYREELYSVTPSFSGNILKSVMKQLIIESSMPLQTGTLLNYKYGLKVNNVFEYLDYGDYIVYKVEKKEDSKTYTITCYDKMLYAMKTNEQFNITYPIKIKAYLQKLATKIGLELEDTTFYNQDLYINEELYVGLEYTYRDILDQIAQATGSAIIINSSGKLEVIYPNNTGDTIDENYIKDSNVDFGENYGAINTVVLSRSGGSDKISLSQPENLPDNQKIPVVIEDNQILAFNNRALFLSGILQALYGLTYAICDYSSTGIMYYDFYDKYNVHIGNNTYACLMLNDEQVISNGIVENIHADMPEQAELDYTKMDKTDIRINQTYSIVDKQNQVIEQVVSNVSTQNNKISTLTQRVDSIDAKIQDIADITVTAESSRAFVELENINRSEPIVIDIYPIGSNITRLYPRSNLYPSSQLYPLTRKIRFTRTYEEEGQTLTDYFDYELPDDLLYYDETHYDEFILNYESTTCQVIKKCKYNADGTVGLLTNEVRVDYPYPTLQLYDGDYRIEILAKNSGYIKVRLMGNNIYTTQFATRVEMTSEINASANQIMSTVDETYATKDTTNSLSTRIKQTAKSIEIIATDNETSAGLTIRLKNEDGTQIDQETANITMSGLVRFTDLSNASSTVINGSNITTGIIKSTNYQAGVSGTSINLVNGTIDTKGFKVDSSGSMTSTSGTIGGWSISSNALYTSGNNFYLGTSGITANIGGTDRYGIIFKAGSNFGVNSSGNLYCNNIEASNGNFSNCNLNSSCDVSAGAVSGVLSTSTIPNLSASKITSGTIDGDLLYGVSASFGDISCSDLDAMAIGADAIKLYQWGEKYAIGGYTGEYFDLTCPYSITTDWEGKITSQSWVRLRFGGGILWDVNYDW